MASVPLTSRKTIVAPSVLAADWLNLRSEIQRIEAAGADWLHMDIMDGHFVDNISFGPAFVGFTHQCATVPLDVHLMIEHPEHYVPRFLPCARNISVHVEARHDVSATLSEIRAAGCGAGLVLNPDTPFSAVIPHLNEIDLLLVMTVVPGFGGQAFMPEMLAKISAAREFREKQNLDFHIQVDGGITPETATACHEAGANVFVAGTAVFRAPDPVAAIGQIKRLA